MKCLLYGVLAVAAAHDEGLSLLQVVASKRFRAHEDPAPQFLKPPPNSASDVRAASATIPGTHDLQFTTLSVNNLGGLGPDSTQQPVLRYDACTQQGGRPVDCVVTADQQYKAAKPEKNGVFGQLGNINLKNDASGTFTISFVDSETNEPVRLNEFFFAMFDMDTGNGWSTDGQQRPAENLEITGYKNVFRLPTNKSGSVKVTDDGFTASDHGLESDNPSNPFTLTTQQVERTVQFLFPAGLSSFSFTYHNDRAGPGENAKGRNVLFAGMSSLYLCNVKKLNMDFDLAEVVRNNLGGMGPDFDEDEGILYEKIATVGGNPVDLEINAMTDYTVWNTSKNGKLGYYGQVNLQTGSDVDLKFRLLVHGTQEPFTAEWLYFSVFDLDHAKVPQLWQESVIAANFSTFALSDQTIVNVTELGQGAYKFSSTQKGTGKDNPDDPLRLTHDQKNKAIAFMYRDVSSFTMNFKVGPPERKKKGNVPDGRNFLFAGKSSNDACDVNAYDDIVNDPADHPHDFSVVGPKFEDAGDPREEDRNDVNMDDDTMKEEHEREEEEAEDAAEDAEQLADLADEEEDPEVAKELEEKAEEKEEEAEEIQEEEVQEQAIEEKKEAEEIKEEAEELEEKAEEKEEADKEEAEEMKEQAEEMKEEAEEIKEEASEEEEDALEEKKEEAEDMEEEVKKLEEEAEKAEDEEEAEDLKKEAEELKDEAEEIKEEAEEFEEDIKKEDEQIEEEVKEEEEQEEKKEEEEEEEEKKEEDDEEEKKEEDDDEVEEKKTTTTTTEYNPWPTTTPYE